MVYVGVVMVAVVMGFVCASVLYNAAERTHRRGWLWAIFGFIFSVFALLTFRVVEGPIVKW